MEEELLYFLTVDGLLQYSYYNLISQTRTLFTINSKMNSIHNSKSTSSILAYSSLRSSARTSKYFKAERRSLVKVPLYQLKTKLHSENLLTSFTRHNSFVVPQYSAINPLLVKSNDRASVLFQRLYHKSKLSQCKEYEFKLPRPFRSSEHSNRDERTIKRSQTNIRIRYKLPNKPIRKEYKENSVVSKSITCNTIKPSKTIKKRQKKTESKGILELSTNNQLNKMRAIVDCDKYIDVSILTQIYK